MLPTQTTVNVLSMDAYVLQITSYKLHAIEITAEHPQPPLTSSPLLLGGCNGGGGRSVMISGVTDDRVSNHDY